MADKIVHLRLAPKPARKLERFARLSRRKENDVIRLALEDMTLEQLGVRQLEASMTMPYTHLRFALAQLAHARDQLNKARQLTIDQEYHHLPVGYCNIVCQSDSRSTGRCAADMQSYQQAA